MIFGEDVNQRSSRGNFSSIERRRVFVPEKIIIKVMVDVKAPSFLQ